MRILVADQNALLLAAIAATFGRHCEIVTATRRDACMAHIERCHIDVVVASEKLAGYTGLELLSEVEAVSPTTLRIFAARPETLKRLGTRLDFFGLLGTLHYPIEARKLLVALKVARSKLPPRPKPPQVKHVVLESEWDTGERLALLGQELEDAPALRETQAAAESPVSEAPPTEFWAAPDSAVEHSTLEKARHIAEASSFEVSFEVSFDENPSRYDVTGHVGAWHDAAGTVAEEASPLEVSFDENPNPEAFANDEPLEEAPSPASDAADETPPYLEAGAANDELFSDEPAATATRTPTAYESALAQAQQATAGTRTPAAAPAQQAKARAGQSNTPKPPAAKSTASKPSNAKGPRPRQPTVPTPAQRQAFQRALARRNAARDGGMVEAPPIDFSEMGVMTATRPAATPAKSSRSLSDLARMATTKRPLPGTPRRPERSEGNPAKRHRRDMGRPKRRVFVVGSGIAAVLLVGIVTFELLRATPSGEHGRHGRGTTAQLFSSPSTLPDDNPETSPEIFTPAPPEPQASGAGPNTASGLPQPQTFDPDTAPPDPPPPPALEQPGPLEPPSPGHMGEAPPWVPNSQ
jgi:hypothetical protein